MDTHRSASFPAPTVTAVDTLRKKKTTFLLWEKKKATMFSIYSGDIPWDMWCFDVEKQLNDKKLIDFNLPPHILITVPLHTFLFFFCKDFLMSSLMSIRQKKDTRK